MSRRYEPEAIESAAQKAWGEARLFEKGRPSAEKFYCLEMFPYPSGKLHMGHVRNYTIGDAVARFQRMLGRSVIYPMGFDAFGLPAENAAIKGGKHPSEWTQARIGEMTAQLERMGFSYDWNRLATTCLPDYYRWNQWFFLKFWERGLAYRKAAPVNWCPKCNTVLANEQVHNGVCWRHDDTQVETRNLEQWFFRITDYADRLLANLDRLEGWPGNVREMQRHWIGKSEGAILRFPVEGTDQVIETFTTRPDTVYGITYLVLAPEHPMVDGLVAADRRAGLDEFRRMVAGISAEDRADETKPKHGFALGRNFINPFTGEVHPIFVADYALMGYGTGAVMAVPAHDQRDFEFARTHGLPVRAVIHPEGQTLRGEEMTAAYVEDGFMGRSGEFDGQPNRTSWRGIVELAVRKGWGRFHVQYRIRDWLVSRQRYWGTPIPAVYCDGCGIVPVPEKDLPIVLPKDITFGGQGNPLAGSESFVHTACPKCGGAARRETDTMDTFVDSSWYFLRYLDAKNSSAPFSPAAVNAGMPVDQYIGGITHATMHLIYARFFNMVLHDMGMVAEEEPFRNLLCQGMVQLETYRCPQCDYITPKECVDGKCATCGSAVVIGKPEAMQKSKRNVVDPGEIIGEYGADTARLFVLFAAPPDHDFLWSQSGVEGAYRFLRRVFDLVEDRAEAATVASATDEEKAADREVRRKMHETIQRVQRDVSTRFQFNTAVSALMELLNALQAHGRATETSREAIETLLLCLAPMAPHLAEDRWQRLGKSGFISEAAWPKFDESAMVTETVEVPVTVNGKLKGTVRVAPDADQATALAAAAAMLKTDISQPRKVIYKQGKILNLVL